VSERRVPPLVLERWLCEEASAEERALVERAYAPEERARLKSADAALRARLIRSPVRARLVVEQAARRRRHVQGGAAALVAAAAAFALTVLPARDAGPGGGEPRVEVDRAKGLAPELRIYRSTPHGPERVASGTRARSHDLVQLALVGVGSRCAAVFSVDGRGTFTWHYRSGEALAGERGEQRLPHAYELDDAPAFERFWMVVGACPLALDVIEARARALARDEAARALASLAVPAGLTLVEARLVKEEE
jgi:hypothetical protein